MTSRSTVALLTSALISLPVSACSPTQLPPAATPPPASAGHSLVYANDLSKVLLVNAGLGGASDVPNAATRTKIWSWDGTRWTVIDSAGPPVRNLAGVAYDSRRHVLVMHGGTYDATHSYDETWEWSQLAGWRKFSGATPGLRDHTQMAYDSVRGRSVLFGGSGADPNVASLETWEFDGVLWQKVASTGPAARVHHAMQYDPGRNGVVVFGGFTPGSADLGDSWIWNGLQWTQVANAASPRTHARMAYDRGLGTLVMVGGMGPGVSGLGTLRLSGNSWTSLALIPEPPARYLADAAYDVKRGVLVLFGGGDPAGMNLFNDTWEFDGTRWRRADNQ